MDWRYQIVLLAANDADQVLRNALQAEIISFLDAMDTDPDRTIVLSKSVRFVTSNDVLANRWDPKFPMTGVYFGASVSNTDEEKAAAVLIDQQYAVLPVVEKLSNVSNTVPSVLKAINGLECKGPNDLAALRSAASVVLENLQLQRATRRVFISYRRQDSSSAALQIYHKLDGMGYRVFLDTHSLRVGVRFQDHLFHDLVDSDILVLLDSPQYIDSYWTVAELAQASSALIGILQVVWPGHTPNPITDLSQRVYLRGTDFVDISTGPTEKSELTAQGLENISIEVEKLRARTVGARYTNLVREFVQQATDAGLEISLQPNRQIVATSKAGKVSILQPAIGIPKSPNYHDVDIFSRQNPASGQHFLLYDSQGILESWITHLGWLDGFLPIKSRAISSTKNWISELQ